MCMRACVRTYMRTYMRACVRACVLVCVQVCMFVCLCGHIGMEKKPTRPELPLSRKQKCKKQGKGQHEHMKLIQRPFLIDLVSMDSIGMP